MTAPPVAVARTGTANLASVLAGLERAGAAPFVADEPDAIADAPLACLPGVGAFAAAMAELVARGLDAAFRERIAAGRPTLSVCLGLQLLAGASEESPGVAGLGLFDAPVRRFPDTVRVPQLGWNALTTDPGCELLVPGYVYFANSYRLLERPEGWRAAWADHGGPFVAALERGAVLACQFHPELSGRLGAGLLERWLARGRAAC